MVVLVVMVFLALVVVALLLVVAALLVLEVALLVLVVVAGDLQVAPGLQGGPTQSALLLLGRPTQMDHVQQEAMTIAIMRLKVAPAMTTAKTILRMTSLPGSISIPQQLLPRLLLKKIRAPSFWEDQVCYL